MDSHGSARKCSVLVRPPLGAHTAAAAILIWPPAVSAAHSTAHQLSHNVNATRPQTRVEHFAACFVGQQDAPSEWHVPGLGALNAGITRYRCGASVPEPEGL